MSIREKAWRRGAGVVGVALLLIMVVVLAWRAAAFVPYGRAALHYPYQLNSVEGRVLNETNLVMGGGSLYHPIDRAPFTTCNYPPAFHVLAGTLGRMTGNTLAAGRALSLMCAVLLAAAIAAAVWQATAAEDEAVVRALAGVVAGLGFLSVGYVRAFAALMRTDLLAYLLAYAGFLAFLRWARDSRCVFVAIPLFVGAASTRQSTVAAAMACCVAAALVRFRLGAGLAVGTAALGAATAWSIDRATDGWFLFHTVVAARDVFSWQRVASFVTEMVGHYAVEIAIAGMTAVSLGLLVTGRGRGRRPAWPVLALALYLPAAFVVTLTVGKLGSDVNYLIEFMAVVWTCCGVALARAVAGARRPAASRRAAAEASVAAVVVPALLLWRVSLGYSDLGMVNPIPRPALQAAIAGVVDRVRRSPEPVMSEDPLLAVLAGKPVEFTPLEMSQLAYRGVWRPAPLITRFDRREFSLLVLRFDLFGPVGHSYTAFTPAMITAMRRGYRADGVRGGYWLYVPRDPGDDGGATVPGDDAEAAKYRTGIE